jgi:hypothetical protein
MLLLILIEGLTMNKRIASILLASTAIAVNTHSVYAQDGFNGQYQSAPPQQWQPVAPQQGYGAPPPQDFSQQGYPQYQGGAPNTQYSAGQFQPGGQQPLQGYSQFDYQHGYTPQQRAYPDQGQNSAKSMQGDANEYFDNLDKNGGSKADLSSEVNPNPLGSTGMNILRKIGKGAAVAAGAYGAGYLMNKAYNRNPNWRATNNGTVIYNGQAYAPVGGVGSPMGMYGPQTMAPGMGYGMVPGGMVPGGMMPMGPGMMPMGPGGSVMERGIRGMFGF